jgi:hypothetical protein
MTKNPQRLARDLIVESRKSEFILSVIYRGLAAELIAAGIATEQMLELRTPRCRVKMCDDQFGDLVDIRREEQTFTLHRWIEDESRPYERKKTSADRVAEVSRIVDELLVRLRATQ